MTFVRMIEWLSGSPAEANAAFEGALDAEPAAAPAPPGQLTTAQKRALLAAGIKARGETPRLVGA